jgi:AraC family transcriptional regulator of adaptative response/methylated-DNA-[protein]-cysteine methyltransferase
MQRGFCAGASSLGFVLLTGTDEAVHTVSLGDDLNALQAAILSNKTGVDLIPSDVLNPYLEQIIAFIENPEVVLDIPYILQGTPFQKQVWAQLTQIPLGQTQSYQTVAHHIGRPKAVRAVAGACAANRLSLIIPCHRVIASNGQISGYRWGVARKTALLQRESAILQQRR